MSVHQKILIVDDREENLIALEMTLNETGTEIVKAFSGDEALRASLKHDFALAILDVQMPNMDGYELAELFRNDEKTQHLPIIFLTAALTHEMDVFRGYEAGAIDYITKPYNPFVLLCKVKMFLDLDRQRAELHRQGVLLEAANEELKAFAYSVSHDLRTPLRSMDGFSHALLEDYGDKLDAEGRDYLQRIRVASQKMAHLIDDLLQLSRVTRGELDHSEVDLSKLAQAVAAELQESAPERQVTFDIAPGVTAEGDARMIRIALENLLGNAWKFTGKNPQAKIEFGLTNHDGKPAYFVRDDGAGFDMAYADKLFQPFQRLHSGAEFGGTGIGLATVARIIGRHGGRVWAESAVEQGTTVYFTL